MPPPQERAHNETSLEVLISEYKTFSNLQVIKNLVVLSVGCLLAICAYDGLVILQSTLNQESGIGVISVAVQFGFSCVTALLLPEYLFGKIGCKWVITICLVLFVPYIASNFYPHWSLMIPASILIGLANSLYWAAQSAYLNHLSILYSWNSKRSKTVASIQKYSKEFQMGGQEVDLNAQVSNNCVTDLNKELGDEIVENNKNDLKQQAEKSFRQGITHPGKFEKVDLNAHVPNNCVSELNKELGDEIIANNKNDLMQQAEKSFSQGITAPRNDEDFGKIIRSSSIERVNSNTDAKMSELLVSTTARFFGIHGLIYLTCHVWGNLLSYYVLRIGAVDEELLDVNNTLCQCGIDFCNSIQTNCSTSNLREPRDDLRNLLIGVFVGISALSVFFILFCLDELKIREKNVTLSWEYIAATCQQVKDKRQLLLIPMSLNVGVMQGFVMGDFTKDFVACAWGVHHVGLVTACMGATLALSSSLSSFLVKHVGRRTLFLAAKGMNVAAVVCMYLWKPTASESFMFFILSGMLGAVLGTFWSQLRAFYGVLFKQKEGAAFANYQLWHAIGMAMTFAYSSFICTAVKIYIYLAFSTFGMIGYLLAERMHASAT